MPPHNSSGSLKEEHHELGILPPYKEQPSNPLRPAQSTPNLRQKTSLLPHPNHSSASISYSDPSHTVITPASDWQDHTQSDISKPPDPAWPGQRVNLTQEQDPIPNPADDPKIYPGPLQLSLLMLGISLAAFVVALDRTIVATAIPQITDDFHSPGDVGWFGSAYLLTSCAFQPTYGRIFAHFDVRGSFLVALGLFEVGSLICGIAQSAVMLLVGRAIAGLGCAGVFAGVMAVITLAVPLTKRPIYMSFVGSMYVSLLLF